MSENSARCQWLCLRHGGGRVDVDLGLGDVQVFVDVRSKSLLGSQEELPFPAKRQPPLWTPFTLGR